VRRADARAPQFFNDIVGLLGALGFWPLTIFFPTQARQARV